MRILILQDERNTASYLRKGLAENGFVVDIARQETGLDLARKENYDLLVLSAAAGLPVFLELRRSGKETPVLFLTTDMTNENQAEPLAQEALSDSTLNEYVPKPFTFSDFLGRVRSALRLGTPNTARLALSDLEVDLIRHRVIRGGRRLDLTPKEFLLLSLLVRHSGEVLSRAVIADQVWGINFDSNTNFVDVHIRRLRAKIDDPFDKKLIHTVRGSGYVMEERNAA